MNRHMRLRISLVGAVLSLVAAPPVSADIYLRLSPSPVTVNPGEIVTVELNVYQAAAAFNAFDASVRFDPARLTFVPAGALSDQIGDLMANACANRFHQFSAGTDSLKITLSLLCNQTTVTGPGVIYKVKFQAGTTTGLTKLKFGPFTEFYDGGFFVRPVQADSMDICIVNCATGVGDGEPGVSGLMLESPAPNPRLGSGPGTITFSLPTGGQVRFDLLDVQGRKVAGRAPEWFASGRHVVPWALPGVPSGAYFLRLTTESGAALQRGWLLLR